MRAWRLAAVAVGLAVAVPQAGSAEPDRVLTIEDVLELARSSAPSVQLALTDVAAARSELAGARVLSPNPALAGAAGRRWGEQRTAELEVSLQVPLELWGQRGARIERAERGIEVAARQADDARRLASGAVLRSFFAALHRQAIVELADERRRLSQELLDATVERRRAGDVSVFEVNLARGEVSRAESAVSAARGVHVSRRADLLRVLGLPADERSRLEGELSDRSFLPGERWGEVSARPDVAAAEAARRGADAGVRLADRERWPGLAVRATYGREEGADIATGGIVLSLPIFDRGQRARSLARVERHRAHIRQEALTRRASLEVAAAAAAHAAAEEALARLEAEAVPLAIDNEAMAREAYAAGKLDLAALLVVRREALDTRREHLDRALGAALAAVDLWVALGAPPIPEPQPRNAP